MPLRSVYILDALRRSRTTDSLLKIIKSKLPYHKLKDYQVTPEKMKDTLPAVLEDFDIEPGVKGMLSRCWAAVPEDRPEIRWCFNYLRKERSRRLMQDSAPQVAFSDAAVKRQAVTVKIVCTETRRTIF